MLPAEPLQVPVLPVLQQLVVEHRPGRVFILFYLDIFLYGVFLELLSSCAVFYCLFFISFLGFNALLGLESSFSIGDFSSFFITQLHFLKSSYAVLCLLLSFL